VTARTLVSGIHGLDAIADICLQVQQVNVIRLEPPQCLLHSSPDELWVIAELAAAVGPDIVAELGG
jgi:hypothetical protein